MTARRYYNSCPPPQVNNAGIGSNTGHVTVDGYEMTFQVDYLGHYLLTDLLMPALRCGPRARPTSP